MRATGITITRLRSPTAAMVNMTRCTNTHSRTMTTKDTHTTSQRKPANVTVSMDTNIMPPFRLTTAMTNTTTTASSTTRRRRAMITGHRATPRSRMPQPLHPGPAPTVTAITTMTPPR